MIRFEKKELATFLRALDRHLGNSTSIVVVGGAAASLGYDSGTSTADVDIFIGFTSAVAEAGRDAQEETGLAVAIDRATITDLPYNYESRIKQAPGLHFKKLTLLVPDKYDLVLSKAMRCYPHDLEAIEGIHQQHALGMKTLVERFEYELMNEAIGPRKKICLNVAVVVSRLYGVVEARKLAARWDVPMPSGRKKGK